MWQQIYQMIAPYAFYIIFILLAIVYRLGFAKKLPLLKNVIIYVMLAIGCIPLTILEGFGLPVIASMSVAVLLLVIVRFRQARYKTE